MVVGFVSKGQGNFNTRCRRYRYRHNRSNIENDLKDSSSIGRWRSGGCALSFHRDSTKTIAINDPWLAVTRIEFEFPAITCPSPRPRIATIPCDGLAAGLNGSLFLADRRSPCPHAAPSPSRRFSP